MSEPRPKLLCLLRDIWHGHGDLRKRDVRRGLIAEMYEAAAIWWRWGDGRCGE